MGLLPNADMEPSGFDLTRSMSERRVSCAVHPDYTYDVEEGMWMVHTKSGEYVRPSSGDPYETLAGIASLGLPSREGIDIITVLTGEFRMFTLYYTEGPWTATNRTLPILGPEGEIRIGKFPRDLPIAIGRVVRVPNEDDPYIGVTGRAFA